MLEHPKTYNTQTVTRKSKLCGLKNYRINGQSAGKTPKFFKNMENPQRPYVGSRLLGNDMVHTI